MAVEKDTGFRQLT